MSNFEILLEQRLYNEMLSHAQSTFPEECCGIMFGKRNGKRKKVTRVKRTKNAFRDSERYHRYTIDPKEFLRAEKEAESVGEEIIGVYHSHPNAPAKPSEFDRSHAWRDLSYVVIEINQKDVQGASSWVLRNDVDDFEEEKLVLESAS